MDTAETDQSPREPVKQTAAEQMNIARAITADAEIRSRFNALASRANDPASGPPLNAAENLWMRSMRKRFGIPEPHAAHADDFRSVDWFGAQYVFTPAQAAIVKILWDHWQRNTPDVGDATLLAESDSNSARLPLVFRGCLAWDRMIVPGATKGTHRLQPPA
jgi:hypothetical protein